MDVGSHAYGQASLGFQSGRTAGSFRGHGQCTPCPARNVPSPCLLFPSMWSWLQCHLPREAWPGHPRQSTSVITLFSLLGPVTSFSKSVCVFASLPEKTAGHSRVGTAPFWLSGVVTAQLSQRLTHELRGYVRICRVREYRHCVLSRSVVSDSLQPFGL